MNVTGTHFQYYLVCPRKLWLFSRSIQMEHSSETVAEGKFIHENTHKERAKKYTELELGGIKVDFFDKKNGVIHETKKSRAMEDAHEWQLKYYLYVLNQHGMPGVSGILEYPVLRQRKKVLLSNKDISKIEEMKEEIVKTVEGNTSPPLLKRHFCASCSYFDFCWSGEMPEEL